MSIKLLHSEKIAVDGFSREQIDALQAAFSDPEACQFDFGATIETETAARATDLLMTLPIATEEDPWLGPLLLVSLEDVVDTLAGELDDSDGSFPDAEGLAQLRDGFHALANKISQALQRNAGKIAEINERKAPRW